ncbi:unnamed protein product [Clavelina lepadiformis]|uniref:Methyltransferase type 11 domain-containing protein n=1 Tax=Clavelina lepadiformis TaxID=159417 RepID=A0ABP0F3Y9_CLALP
MATQVIIPHDKEVHFSDIVNELNENLENNIKVYNKYADEYDDLARDLGFKVANHLVKLCMDNLPESMKKNLDKCRVLDVAAGTGLIVEEFRAARFTGSFDGIEGANDMCAIARKKGIYSDLRSGLVTVDNPLPFDDNTYDVVVVCTALTPGHVPKECLFDCIRVLKPKGLLLFNLSHFEVSDPDGECMKCTKEIVEKMHDDGRCECVDEFDAQMFDLDSQYHKVRKNVIHCFQKN